jgi:Flp pilus assembly protein TadB
MYRYAVGRLQVGKRNKSMINAVHVLAGISLPLILLVFILSPLLFLSFLSVYMLFLLLYLLFTLLKTRSLRASLQVPAVISIILFAWSTGFMRELIFPMKKIEGK